MTYCQTARTVESTAYSSDMQDPAVSYLRDFLCSTITHTTLVSTHTTSVEAQ